MYSNVTDEHEAGGNPNSVRFLIIIGILIVVIAFANYVNLTTSGHMARAKEVGVRKILGSSKKQIILQFLMKSLIIVGLAFFGCAVIILYQHLLFREFLENYPDFYLTNNPIFWILSLIVTLAMGAIAGLYPAITISSQKSADVLKGKFIHSTRGTLLFRSHTILQFLMTSCLILSTIVINRQIDFMTNQDLGVQIAQTMVLRAPSYTHEDPTRKFESFRTEVINHSEIREVSASTSIPGSDATSSNIRLLNSESEEQTIQINSLTADQNFISLFDLKLLAVRGYSRDFPSDINQSLVINEKLSLLLGFDSPTQALNTHVIFNRDTLSVIRGIADYHHKSLRENFTPMAFLVGTPYARYVSVKFSTDNLPKMIHRLEQAWERQFPGMLFDFFFFAEDHFNKQYHRDQELSSLISLFSIIAIIVACYGMFALSLHTAEQRRKEIAVKKILAQANSFYSGILPKVCLRL